MKYRRTRFQVSQPLANGVYLCTNFNGGIHILLSKDIFELYTGDSHQLNILEHEKSTIFNQLIKGGFLIEEQRDEVSDYLQSVLNERKDPTMFHIIVNPTLDCNLSCWYCYENKVKNSKISRETEEAICKHIACHFAEQHFKFLKLSFFGGEPFKCPDSIQQLSSFAAGFCEKNNVELLLDFTTNGTLITNSMLSFLKPYSCMFQITLDGNKEQHNRIKFAKNKKFDSYLMTMSNIHRIQNAIPKSSVAIRINFDSETLNNFDDIYNDIVDLDRLRTKIILKKVWQVESASIATEYVNQVIEKLISSNFIIDYYSQGGVCFADRDNQLTINYDGNVFRCTTITSFDKDNALGHLTQEGNVKWDMERTQYLRSNLYPPHCLKCAMLPSCGAPCRKKMYQENNHSCFLEDLHLSIEEYALLQFRFDFIKHKLIASSLQTHS